MAETYRNYKLASGDEIITQVISSNDTYVTLYRPMVTKIVVLDTPIMGGTKEFMLLQPWARMTNEIQFDVMRSQIISDSAPKPEIVAIYLDELEKEDVASDITNEMIQNGEITNDMETYMKNKIMTDLESALEPPTPNIEQPSPAGQPSPEEEPTPPESVMMNFVVPPALFMAFLMSGIVSFNDNDDDDSYEFDIESFMEQAKNKMIKKDWENDDISEIDNHFRDWNPEP